MRSTPKDFFRALPLAAIAALAFLVAGCASTTLQGTWRDPAYTGGAFKRIYVIALSTRDLTARRVLEDVVVAKLVASGVEAVPAWQSIPNEGPVTESALTAAVTASRADGMLMVRLLGVDTQLTVWSPPIGPGLGWYGYYSGWYAYPQITQTQTAVAETTLFDVRSQRIVWSATSQTMNPTSMQQEAPGFADVILGSLRKDGLLPAANK